MDEETKRVMTWIFNIGFGLVALWVPLWWAYSFALRRQQLVDGPEPTEDDTPVAASSVTSSNDREAPNEGAATGVVATTKQGDNGTATPNNDDKALLSDNDAEQPTTNVPLDRTPAEARALIRAAAEWDATVDMCARAVLDGVMKQTAAIKWYFRCSESSREDSVYQKARAAVVAKLDAARSPVVARPDGTLIERSSGEPLYRDDGDGYVTRDGRKVAA